MLLARGSVTITSVNDGSSDKFYRAWADSADGSTGFSTTDSNKKYFGVYAGTTPPASYKAYSWTAIKGAGVQGSTDYYLASHLSEGVRKDTQGWTDTPQELTPTNKYLWNKKVTHYSDNEIFNDKTEILSGTEIFTDKADDNAVVHVEVDGKSYQNAGSGKNLLNPDELRDYLIREGAGVELVDNGIRVVNFKENLTNMKPLLRGRFKENTVYTVSFTTKKMLGNQLYVRAYYTDGSYGNLFTNINLDSYITKYGVTSSGKTVDFLYFSYGSAGFETRIALDDALVMEGVGVVEYEPPAPSPDYPIEIHSLNDVDVVSSVGRENFIAELSPMSDKIKLFNAHIPDEIKGKKVTLSFRLNLQNGVPNSQNRIGVEGSSIDSEGKRVYYGTWYELNSGKNYNDVVSKAITIPKTFVGNTLTFRTYTDLINADLKEIGDIKLELGSEVTPYAPSFKSITESTNSPYIDKINLLLDEPLRSVGDVKDRLFRDTDGLWKVERNTRKIQLGSQYLSPKDETAANTPSGVRIYYYSGFSTFKMNERTTFINCSHFVYNSSRNNSDGAKLNHVGMNSSSGRLGHNIYFAVNEADYPNLESFNNWLLSQESAGTPVTLEVQSRDVYVETLSQALQDKLNNLRTFKESNYIYTVLPDKSNILSEDLKPTLHATFKSKAWAGNHAGYPSVIGVYGDSAKLLYLSTTAESMTFNADGLPTPSSQAITLTAHLQNTVGTAMFTAIPYNGSTALASIVLGGSGNTRTLNQAQFPASADRIQIKASLGGLEDTVTIMKLKHGLDGQNAVVGYLTNESITLAANNAGTVSSFSNATGNFKVFEGVVDKTSSATFRVKAQSGAVGAISTTGVYTVSSMTSDSAQIVFEATYGSVKIDRSLSLAKSRQGVKGDTGSILGENQWIGHKYSYPGSTRIYPSFDHIQGLNPIATQIFDDSTRFTFDDDYYIAHFQSNLYVSVDKQITTTVIHDDDLTIYCDGEVVVSKNTTISTPYNITFNLKAGWNKIDVLLHEIAGGDQVLFGTKLSNLVEHLSYIKGADGATGPQGVSITKVDVQYYLSTSATVLSGGSWSTNAPAWVDGRFMWSKTVTTYSSGSPTESTPVCITGATGASGATGRGVSSIVEQFYLSDSKTTQTGGSWSTTAPTWSPGKYVWTRSLITYTTGTPTTSTTEPLVSSEWEAVNELELGGRNLAVYSTIGEYSGGNNRDTLGSKVNVEEAKINVKSKLSDLIAFSIDNVSQYSKLNISFFSDLTSPTMYYKFNNSNQSNMKFTKTNNFFTGVLAVPDGAVSLVIGLGEYPQPTIFKPYYIDKVMIEKGNKATDWSPAPEDVQADIDSKANQTDIEATLSAIASDLLVKQQEIEAAASAGELSAFIERYNNEQKTRATEKSDSETALADAQKAISLITNELDDMAETWNFYEKYIKFANGTIIIGDDTKGNHIQLSDDRIAFFSNNLEVASISQGLMTIEAGAFVKEIQVAKYIFQETTTNHLTIRYVG